MTFFIKEKKPAGLEHLLPQCEECIDSLLLKLSTEKRYDQLQLLEQTLRRCLFKTLENKGAVAESLMKKDLEMNKEILEKLNLQVPTENENENPRFGIN